LQVSSAIPFPLDFMIKFLNARSARIVLSAVSSALILLVLFNIGENRRFALYHLHPGAVIILWLLFSFFAYQYWEPLRLLKRHAFLMHAAKRRSRFRRCFWKGTFLRIWLAGVSLLTSAVALILAAHLREWEWKIILIGIAIFIGILAAESKWQLLGSQIAQKYRLAVTLRVAVWMSVAVTVPILTIFLFSPWVDVPFTKHLTVLEVVQTTWGDVRAGALEPQSFFLAVSATATNLLWHSFQVVRVEEGWGRGGYLLLIALTLFWNALKIGVLWIILAGTIAAFHRKTTQLASDVVHVASYFIIALFIVVLGYYALRDLNFVASIDETEACAEIAQHEKRVILDESRRSLENREREFSARMNQPIQDWMDSVYGRAEIGVDRFLDWHFSIKGQYQQLGYLLMSVIFRRADVDSVVADRMAKFIDSEVKTAQPEATDVLVSTLSAGMKSLYHEHEAFLDGLLAQSVCLELPTISLPVDEYLEKSLVGLGAAAGPATARVAAALTTRTATSGAVKRIAVSVAAKFGARAGAAVGAGSGGLLCPPPFNLLCTTLLAGSVWFATDYGINYVDEALHREALRSEIMGVMKEARGVMEAELRFALEAFSWDMFVEMEDWQTRRFNLLRDGGRP
jgi:hypothetical protein